MKDTQIIEKTIDNLTGTKYIKKVEIESFHRYNEDEPEYPKTFWEIKYFKARIKPNDINPNWFIKYISHTDTLEEAIASAILGIETDIFYHKMHEKDMPSRLSNWLKRDKFIVKENYYTKFKWDELQVRKSCSTTFYILINGKWIEDYNTNGNFQYALSAIPKKFYSMHEGVVPYYLDYKNNDNPSHTDYPYFKYKDVIYKSTYYIPNQKCMCGNIGDGGEGIKVKVWDADKFYDSKTVYIEGHNLFYNGTLYNMTDEEFDWSEGYKSEKQFHNLMREKFPEAKNYSSWMNSGRL